MARGSDRSIYFEFSYVFHLWPFFPGRLCENEVGMSGRKALVMRVLNEFPGTDGLGGTSSRLVLT